MDNSLIDKAKSLAHDAHKRQMYGDKPYMYHVDQVVTNAQPYGEQAVIIAYLHDVVEDTPVSRDDIFRHFGKDIAECVDILTDPDLKCRTERKLASHQKLSQADQNSPQKWALIVKAADRLANTQSCVDTQNKDKLNMYQKEYPAFRAAAYRHGLCDALWQQLDALNND